MSFIFLSLEVSRVINQPDSSQVFYELRAVIFCPLTLLCIMKKFFSGQILGLSSKANTQPAVETELFSPVQKYAPKGRIEVVKETAPAVTYLELCKLDANEKKVGQLVVRSQRNAEKGKHALICFVDNQSPGYERLKLGQWAMMLISRREGASVGTAISAGPISIVPELIHSEGRLPFVRLYATGTTPTGETFRTEVGHRPGGDWQHFDVLPPHRCEPSIQEFENETAERIERLLAPYCMDESDVTLWAERLARRAVSFLAPFWEGLRASELAIDMKPEAEGVRLVLQNRYTVEGQEHWYSIWDKLVLTGSADIRTWLRHPKVGMASNQVMAHILGKHALANSSAVDIALYGRKLKGGKADPNDSGLVELIATHVEEYFHETETLMGRMVDHLSVLEVVDPAVVKCADKQVLTAAQLYKALEAYEQGDGDCVYVKGEEEVAVFGRTSSGNYVFGRPTAECLEPFYRSTETQAPAKETPVVPIETANEPKGRKTKKTQAEKA